MTTEQEDQIAKLNRFIINVQLLQDISVKQVEDRDERGRKPHLKSPWFDIPFPEYLGNGSITNKMASDLKEAVKNITDGWIREAKAQIIKIVEQS